VGCHTIRIFRRVTKQSNGTFILLPEIASVAQSENNASLRACILRSYIVLVSLQVVRSSAKKALLIKLARWVFIGLWSWMQLCLYYKH